MDANKDETERRPAGKHPKPARLSHSHDNINNNNKKNIHNNKNHLVGSIIIITIYILLHYGDVVGIGFLEVI